MNAVDYLPVIIAIGVVIGIVLIKRRRGTPAQSVDPVSIARHTWDLDEGPMGQVEILGVKVDVTLFLISQAKLHETLQAAASKRAADSRIDHMDVLTTVFPYVLASVCGQMREGGAAFEQWEQVCRGMIGLWAHDLAPAAKRRDSGGRPERLMLRTADVPALVGYRAKVELALDPVLEFLGS